MSQPYRMKDGYNNKHNSTELSEENSCDTSDHFSFSSGKLSPIPPLARKLDFTNVGYEDPVEDASMNPMSFSPPYKRVRALRLQDSPHTPKTLLDKCSTPTMTRHSRTRLFPPRLEHPTISNNYPHPTSDDDSAIGSLPPDDSAFSRSRRPVANINPFTPQGQALKKKRALSKTPNRNPSPGHPAKRLRESNISRYSVEFSEPEVIGRGEFGVVMKCKNNLDGCVYAIKRSIKPVAGSVAERTALNEVYAHAALGKHSHVVRYYSAWAEDDHMLIQNEYCDGGSLQEKLKESGPLEEKELKVLLKHVSHGLQYMHSTNLAHMDLKPGNIFISRSETGSSSDSEDDDRDREDDDRPPTYMYKIGDLGHVTSIEDPKIEDGDCRYLPREVLQENVTDLTKADIFSFGLTLFEAAGGGPLPQNGEEWQSIRDGKLPDLPNLSREFNQLIKQMIHPDTSQRPSAHQLCKHPVLGYSTLPSRAELLRELAASNTQNQLLTKKLDEANNQLHQVTNYIKSMSPNIAVNESMKLRTRSAKRLQPVATPARSHSARRNNPKVDTQLAEIMQSVTAPKTLPKQRNRGPMESVLKATADIKKVNRGVKKV